VQETTSQVDAIERAWDRGNDSVSGADYADAQARRTRAERLHSAAKAEVMRATRALVNDDDALAQAVAPAVQAVLPGMTVEVYSARPEKSPASVPVVHIVQSKAPERNTIEGTISGAVEIRAHFPAWVSTNPIGEVALTQALAKVGLLGSTVTTTNGHPAETVIHTTTVQVRHGAEPIPVIAHDPQEHRLLWFASALTDDFVSRTWNPLAEKSRVLGHKPECTILSTKVDGAGVRHTTARIVLKGTPRVVETYAGGHRKATINGEVTQAITTTVDSAVGKFATGLGRVESVKVTGTQPFAAGGRDITAVIVFVSRKA